MSKLIGTNPNQVPSNADLGTAAFMDKKEFLLSKGSEMSAINAVIPKTAVDVFIYDTSKDSDGGAWRKRTQHTSWYNERLNTATRGSRREFPAVAVIVLVGSVLTIYDADDVNLSMWMVFNQGTDYGIFLGRTGAPATSTAMLNGLLCVGRGNNGYGEALLKVNFISERSVNHNSNSGWLHLEPISGRNLAATTGLQIGALGAESNIVNIAVNDVAMTVLPNAPIDPATGLPVPTIAVACESGTSGGISVINNDGTVASYSGFRMSQVLYDPDNNLYYANNHISGVVGFRIYKAQSAISPTYVYYYGHSLPEASINVSSGSAPGSGDGLYGFAKSKDNLFLGYRDIASYRGLNIVNENVDIRALGMVAYVKSNYNTGYLVGDIKGAWLSDTTQETVVSSDLVVDGGFETAANWTTVQSSATITRTNVSARTGSWGITATSTGGSNVYSGRQITGLIVGKLYTISIDYNNLNHTTGIAFNTAFAGTGTSYGGSNGLAASTSWQTLQVTFTAITTSVWVNIFAQGTIYLDNLSLRLADADRSVNNKGLQTFGNITKTPVATGADLVAYSGFTSSNYLKQPYNSALDFGTGDFFIAAWIKTSNTANNEYFIWRGVSTAKYALRKYDGSALAVFEVNGVATTGRNIADGHWHFIVGLRRSGRSALWIDAREESASTNSTMQGSVSDTSAELGIGASPTGLVPAIGTQIALARISATVPSEEQIRKMYEDEKVLFQDNAKATLYGTSDAVTALAYDEDTELLHVGTSAGRSDFQGLRRINNTTRAIGTAISAVDGFIVEE